MKSKKPSKAYQQLRKKKHFQYACIATATQLVINQLEVWEKKYNLRDKVFNNEVHSILDAFILKGSSRGISYIPEWSVNTI